MGLDFTAEEMKKAAEVRKISLDELSYVVGGGLMRRREPKRPTTPQRKRNQ